MCKKGYTVILAQSTDFVNRQRREISFVKSAISHNLLFKILSFYSII